MEPSRPCNSARCVKYATKGGRCDDHQPKHGWVHDKSSSDRGYGAKWRRLAKSVMVENSYLCVMCKMEGAYTRATDVDHIIPKSQGGTNERRNLQPLCKAHHKSKTLLERNERKKNKG